MDLFQIIVLALIQGFTEFLPISSSAHLILPSEILGWPDQGLAFDVAVHVGSLVAVLAYFHKDVLRILKAWFASVAGRGHCEDAQLGWYIIVATIPAGLAGLVLDNWVENELRSTLVIATTTVFFGLLLGLADLRARQGGGKQQLNWTAVLLIGVAQAVALVPGTSRSGITMTAALLMGMSRELSARFSFLLSIPLIAAAGILKTLDLIELGGGQRWLDIGLGTLLSALAAYCCIHVFLRYINQIGFLPFVVYRLILGAALYIFVLQS